MSAKGKDQVAFTNLVNLLRNQMAHKQQFTFHILIFLILEMIQSGLLYAAPRENELDKSENVCRQGNFVISMNIYIKFVLWLVPLVAYQSAEWEGHKSD